jgi:hypothetical protein
MIVERVLLVCVGSLGDLAWRKFIAHAREIEQRDPNVELLVVDISWDEAHGVPLERELRWRIGRRQLELLAEKINDGKAPGLTLKFDLDRNPLPWDVDEFFEGNYLEGPAAIKAEHRENLHRDIQGWVSYFVSRSLVTGLPRYCSGLDKVGSNIKRLKDNGWKIALYMATPPQTYPDIISRWRYLADRIVLEKPACGLDPETLLYPGPSTLLEAVAGVPASSQVVTNDHYNSKSLVRVLDRIKDYGLFDGLISPGRIKRIVVQLLETAPLPLGRCHFYNGAGGAFGDMVPHILQTVRASLGLNSSDLEIEFKDNFCWARYDDAPVAGSFVTPSGVPYIYEPGYYQPLSVETETFVAFEAVAKVEGYPDIPLYCRTGKGFQFEKKSLRLDVEYDDKGSEMSLLFNFIDNSITIADAAKGFVLAFGQVSINDAFQSGVPSMNWEYKGVFDTLINSEWKPDALDNRYFPSIIDAAAMSTTVFERLVRERRNPSRIINSYSAKRPSTQIAILNFLDNKARWD